MRRLRILLFHADYSHYGGAMYQHQFYAALCRHHDVHCYGPGFEGHDRTDTIDDVMRICPFEPDLICFSSSWEWEGPWGNNPTESDPQPSIEVSTVGVPTVFVLNKEYKKLDKKFEFIRRNRIQSVFTAHHSHAEWEGDIGTRFVHLPFAHDPDLFRDYGEPKRIDFGFSGNLHTDWTDIRLDVKQRLFRWGFRRRRHAHLRIHWADRVADTEIGEGYARLINSSHVWLSTTSARGLVGPRFYEVMAAHSLLLCNRATVYGDLFLDGEHCVMFEPDLSDFDEKLLHYLTHDDERRAIVERAAHHVFRHHTWDARIRLFTEVAEELIHVLRGG